MQVLAAKFSTNKVTPAMDSKAWVQCAAQLLPLAIFTSLPNYLQFCRFPTHFTLLRYAVVSCKLHNDSSHCGLLLHLVGFLSWCDILLLRAPLCANKCDFPSLSPTLYHRQSHHQAYLIIFRGIESKCSKGQ